MRRVLFVDDEPRVLDGLRRALRGCGSRWDLRFADSGRAALALMETTAIDVVISDFRMPAMDGRELLEAVRCLHPDTARLVLSGHADQDDLLEVAAVAHQFLPKPCDTPRLVDAVGRVLSIRDQLDGIPIRAELGAMKTLPVAAGSLRHLLEILESPEICGDAVARVVEGDVALTVQVLRLVNTGSCSAGSWVTDVAEAITRLGLGVVRSVVRTWDDGPCQQGAEAAPRAALERLHRQALVAGRLAQRLAHPDEAGDAFCAAVMMECGRLALAGGRPDLFHFPLGHPGREAQEWTEVETGRFGLTHAEAGAYLLGLWGFPRAVVEAVARHDRPPDPDATFPFTASQAVQLARQVTAADSGGCGATDGLSDEELESRGALGVVREWRAERTVGRAPGAAA